MRKDLFTLSTQEHERYSIIRKVMKREMRQSDAADLLNLSERQIRNLIGKVHAHGIRGLAHGNRGKTSPKRTPVEMENRIAEIVRTKYEDFKPKLASEKLWQREKIKISDEKLRQIMIVRKLWRVRRRRGQVHSWRERKARLGEMIQMDGSDHDWLEGRGPKLVLMGFIDDATNCVFGRFYDYEGIYPAMDGLERYLRRYGVPQRLYLDRHSTYRARREATTEELLRGEEAVTQFERAAKELGIKVIHAYSAQAKGRIERLFGTLQDRLVKEMRLAGISSLEDANRFVEGYWPVYNQQFSKEALLPGDLHRPLSKTENLARIFCLKGSRTINNGYLVRWQGRLFVLQNPTLGMRRRTVEIQEQFDGRITIRFNGRDLSSREIRGSEPRPAPIKQPEVKKSKKGKYIPPSDHPWRRSNEILHREWAQGRF